MESKNDHYDSPWKETIDQYWMDYGGTHFDQKKQNAG